MVAGWVWSVVIGVCELVVKEEGSVRLLVLFDDDDDDVDVDDDVDEDGKNVGVG